MKLPTIIGTPVPIAKSSNNPPASPLYITCPIVENKNADSPNPASTVPVALARVLSGKDFAAAFTLPVRPAEPPIPVMNMQNARRRRRKVDTPSDGLERRAMACS
jgi:hypothetical protein